MTRNAEEIWRRVPGYEGLYAVSSFGAVRSCNRVIDRSSAGQGSYVLVARTLKQRKDKDGYLIVDLNSGKSKKTFKVHRLVAEAFISNPENLPHVDHLDGDRGNNALENLKWSSVKDNLLSKHNIMQASGHRGVRLHRTGKYQAYCHNHTKQNRFVHIGLFQTLDAAVLARQNFINGRSDVSTR